MERTPVTGVWLSVIQYIICTSGDRDLVDLGNLRPLRSRFLDVLVIGVTVNAVQCVRFDVFLSLSQSGCEDKWRERKLSLVLEIKQNTVSRALAIVPS